MSTKKKLEKVDKEELPVEVAGVHSVVLTNEEMSSIVQILSFAKTVFEQMAQSSEQEGNKEETTAWKARAQLSFLLYSKLNDNASIGEPISRAVH